MKICQYMNNTMEIYTFYNIITPDYSTEILESEDVDDQNTHQYPIDVLEPQYVGNRNKVLQTVIIVTDIIVDAIRKIEINWAKNATFDIFAENGLLQILITVAENPKIKNQLDIYILW